MKFVVYRTTLHWIGQIGTVMNSAISFMGSYAFYLFTCITWLSCKRNWSSQKQALAAMCIIKEILVTKVNAVQARISWTLVAASWLHVLDCI